MGEGQTNSLSSPDSKRTLTPSPASTVTLTLNSLLSRLRSTNSPTNLAALSALESFSAPMVALQSKSNSGSFGSCIEPVSRPRSILWTSPTLTLTAPTASS